MIIRMYTNIMIKVIIINVNVNIHILKNDIVLITNHLGKNPRKGGRPLKDKKFNNIRFLIFLFFIKVNWLIKNDFL